MEKGEVIVTDEAAAIGDIEAFFQKEQTEFLTIHAPVAQLIHPGETTEEWQRRIRRERDEREGGGDYYEALMNYGKTD